MGHLADARRSSPRFRRCAASLERLRRLQIAISWRLPRLTWLYARCAPVRGSHVIWLMLGGAAQGSGDAQYRWKGCGGCKSRSPALPVLTCLYARCAPVLESHDFRFEPEPNGEGRPVPAARPRSTARGRAQPSPAERVSAGGDDRWRGAGQGARPRSGAVLRSNCRPLVARAGFPEAVIRSRGSEAADGWKAAFPVSGGDPA